MAGQRVERNRGASAAFWLVTAVLALGCTPDDGTSDICSGPCGDVIGCDDLLDCGLEADARREDLSQQDSDSDSWCGSEVRCAPWGGMPSEDPQLVEACTDDTPVTKAPATVYGAHMDCGCAEDKASVCEKGFLCWYWGDSYPGCQDTFRCEMPCESTSQCPDGWGCEAQGNDGGTGEDGFAKLCFEQPAPVPYSCAIKTAAGGVQVIAIDGQLLGFAAVRVNGRVVWQQVGDCDSWVNALDYIRADVPEGTALLSLNETLSWEQLGLTNVAAESPLCVALTVRDCEGNWSTCRQSIP